jgi:hypothetical protein
MIGSFIVRVFHRYNSVEKAEHHHGAFSSGFSKDFDVSCLEIHLTDAEVFDLENEEIF